MAASDFDLRYVVSVLDKATRELGNVSRQIDESGKSAKSVNLSIRAAFDSAKASVVAINQALELTQKALSIVGTVASFPIDQFRTLFDVGSDLVRAYDQQIVASTKLATAMKAQGVFSEEAAESIEDFAASLQKVTRFDDDAIVAGQALLGTFIGFGPSLERATKSALDLAAALGTTAEQGFQKLLQAAESGRLTIGRMSVSLSEAEDPTARLTEVLAALEKRFAGTAEALAQVGAGPLDQLANVFGDVKEKLGELVAQTPQFQAFVDAAKVFGERIQEFLGANSGAVIEKFGRIFEISFQVMSATVEGLVVSIEKLTAVATAIGEFFQVFDTAEETAEKIASLERANLNATAGIERSAAAIDAGEESFRNASGAVVTHTEHIEALTATYHANLVELGELREKLAEQQADPFLEARKGVTELVSELKVLKDQFDEDYEAALRLREAATPEALQARTAASIQRGAASVAAAGLTGALAGEGTAADELLRAAEVQKEAAATTSEAGAEVGAAAISIQESAAASSLATVEAAAGVSTAAIDLGTETDRLAGVIARESEVAEETSKAAADHVGAAGAHSGAAAGLQGSATALGGSAAELDSSAQAIIGAGLDLGATAIGIDRAADGLDDAAAALESAASSLSDAASRIGGGGGEEGFAEGAIVTRPTRRTFGEAGPEAVIPLNERGIEFIQKALGVHRGPPEAVAFSVRAENLTLSDQGLESVFNQFQRRLARNVRKRRSIRTVA